MAKITLAKAGIIGLAGFLLYKIVKKGSTLNDLGFTINQVGYNITPGGIILTFFITVNNTRNESVLLNSISADLFFNDSQIGNVVNDLNIDILALQQSVVPISVNLFYSPVIDSLIKMVTAANRTMAVFKLKGTATIEHIPLPLDLKYALL